MCLKVCQCACVCLLVAWVVDVWCVSGEVGV